MELRKLEYLLKVAETHSITEAAKQLYITQPALSQVIAVLEKNYDTKLFERKNGGLELTRSGRIMVEAARRQLLVEANMVRELEDEKGGNAGTLQIGRSVNREKSGSSQPVP